MKWGADDWGMLAVCVGFAACLVAMAVLLVLLPLLNYGVI